MPLSVKASVSTAGGCALTIAITGLEPYERREFLWALAEALTYGAQELDGKGPLTVGRVCAVADAITTALGRAKKETV